MKTPRFWHNLFSALSCLFFLCSFSNSDDDTLMVKIEGGDYCHDANHVHAVDLGLSVKWACCNVGATAPEEYGGYYAWGETEEKAVYNWETYKWCKGSYKIITKYCTDDYYGTVDNKTTLDPADDVAHVKWGGSWRMPTLDEIKELVNNCSWTWTSVNGVYGQKVTGPNGNSIFLPAAGDRSYRSYGEAGAHGDYWSSTLYSRSSLAYGLCFSYGNYRWNYGYGRFFGRSVRPVCD